MKTAKEENLRSIIDYLKGDLDNCLYMYIDISKYGISNPYMTVWHDGEEKIKCVVMRYHTSISIYMDDDYDLENVTEIIDEVKPNSITGTKETIQKLEKKYGDRYESHYGFVSKTDSSCKIPRLDFSEVEEATESDMEEIARLIILDHDIGSYYEVEDFKNQLIERYRTGMGRNFIIRRDGKIIAHIATYAMYENICISGGLMVDKMYRDSLYGPILNCFLMTMLIKEGYTIYGFVETMKRRRFGSFKAGEYGKLFIDVN